MLTANERLTISAYEAMGVSLEELTSTLRRWKQATRLVSRLVGAKYDWEDCVTIGSTPAQRYEVRALIPILQELRAAA